MDRKGLPSVLGSTLSLCKMFVGKDGMETEEDL
jgi:hypothetical protein